MTPPVHARDLPLEDLRVVVELGLARGGHLLTAGEAVIAGRIAALQGPPGRLYARLTGRVPECFAVDALVYDGVPDVGEAVATLAALELVDDLVPVARQLERLGRTALDELCRSHGLPVGGRRADLVARLTGRVTTTGRAWVRVRHRALLRRLERWAMLRRHPDRAAFVVERLGIVRWPEYALTRGPSVHGSRRAALRWERTLASLDELDGDELVRCLADPACAAPGRLDLRGPLLRRAGARARDLERQGEVAQARRVYRGAVAASGASPARFAVRIARTLEAQGRVVEAVEHLRSALPHAAPEQRLAMHRAGRRLARACGRGWAPDRPLRPTRERDLRLAPAPAVGARPLYAVGPRSLPVEAAVTVAVNDAGRQVVRGEGSLFTTLFATLFADAYFLPVPGALPVRRLSGPLDLGSPEFRTARASVVDARLAQIEAGAGPELVAAAWAQWHGTALAGAAWWREADAVVGVAEVLGGLGLALVLRTLLARGWRASRGLPDLVVLPGETARMPAGRPGRLAASGVLVEVKGPGDTLRDEQRWWLDALAGAQVPVEVWRVRPTR